jgi:hypothetical protein
MIYPHQMTMIRMKPQLDLHSAVILETKSRDTINHLFILPSVFPILRLPPIHWAIHLDIPQLIGWLASHSCVDLKQKIKSGFDIRSACFIYDRVRCFEELIPFFTSKARELLIRALRESTPEFLETILKTIDPKCSNSELLTLPRTASAQHRAIVERFVETHPRDQRNQANLKVRSQTRWMASRIGRRSHRRYDDSDEENRRLNAEYAELDDYPAEGEWVWAMDSDRTRLFDDDFGYDFENDCDRDFDRD